MANYVIRRSTRDDLALIQRLMIDNDFLSSGPPDSLSEEELELWLDRRYTCSLVACPADQRELVVGHAQVSRKVSPSRAGRADLEDVLVDKAHIGNRLGRRLMGGVIWAAGEWDASRMEWLSEDVPKRQDARIMYQDIGAVLVSGPKGEYFRLKFPYDAERYNMAPYVINPWS